MSSAELLQHILDWKCSQEKSIFNQLSSLGSNLDFEKSYFTLDHGMGKAVIEAFVRLHDSELIYRRSRLVNWCCFLRSAISDIEVDHVSIEQPKEMTVPGYDKPVKFGYLYYFAYKVEDAADSEIVVATTRPETMLGDTALAVHPNDDKYVKFHGKCVRNPFTNNIIPIILDEDVDRGFGTGAVKITPAHDFKDYETGIKHNLDLINIFNDEGKIELPSVQFSGLMRFTARDEIVKALEGQNLLRKILPHGITVPLCNRTGDVIEPYLKPQWYLKCKLMARKAIENVKTGELQLMPKHHEAVWFDWLEKIDDWCISRQVTWGHRIPVYTIMHPDVPKGNSFFSFLH